MPKKNKTEVYKQKHDYIIYTTGKSAGDIWAIYSGPEPINQGNLARRKYNECLNKPSLALCFLMALSGAGALVSATSSDRDSEGMGALKALSLTFLITFAIAWCVLGYCKANRKRNRRIVIKESDTMVDERINSLRSRPASFYAPPVLPQTQETTFTSGQVQALLQAVVNANVASEASLDQGKGESQSLLGQP